jgi:hypothetical protein
LFSFTLARAKDNLERKREGTGEEDYKMYIYIKIYIKVSILQDSLCHRGGVIKFVREKGKKSSR